MFILKTNSKKQGVVYFMNVIMITQDKECAETFKTIDEAKKNIQSFKNLFFYEDIEVEIEEV